MLCPMSSGNSPFVPGRRTEFKYKNTSWKNGFIKSKSKHEMRLVLHKTIEKTKEVSLPMSEAMTRFHLSKTLRFSNKIYPSWIKVYQMFIIVQYDRLNLPASVHYRDGKSITFQFLDRDQQEGATTLVAQTT